MFPVLIFPRTISRSSLPWVMAAFWPPNHSPRNRKKKCDLICGQDNISDCLIASSLFSSQKHSLLITWELIILNFIHWRQKPLVWEPTAKTEHTRSNHYLGCGPTFTQLPVGRKWQTGVRNFICLPKKPKSKKGKWYFGEVFLKTVLLKFLITSEFVVAHQRLKRHQMWSASYKQMDYHEEETLGDEWVKNENWKIEDKPVFLLFSSIRGTRITFLRRRFTLIFKNISSSIIRCIIVYHSNLSLPLPSKI